MGGAAFFFVLFLAGGGAQPPTREGDLTGIKDSPVAITGN